MIEILNVAGERYINFGRRPNELFESIAARRLATNTGPPYKFAFARTALKYGLKTVGFERGDALLVPDLICESAVEPLVELGIQPQFYPIGTALEPEWRRLERSVTKSTKALLIVHYFGQPQPISECKAFCHEHSLMLVEDNAHGFGGKINGQLLGTFGTLGVSAPRKSFPIRNGAYLYLGADRELNLSTLQLQLQPSASSLLIKRLKLRMNRISLVDTVMKHRRRIIEYRRRRGPRPPYGSQDGFRDPPIRDDLGMDESIDLYLARQNVDGIGNTRRQIYNIWQEWAVTQGLTPVFTDLSPEALPLVFPAFTQSASSSLQWYERGHRAGVDIHSWPTLPRTIVQRDGGAMRLWERMVCFPIHQEMNIGLLERRLAVL